MYGVNAMIAWVKHRMPVPVKEYRELSEKRRTLQRQYYDMGQKLSRARDDVWNREQEILHCRRELEREWCRSLPKGLGAEYTALVEENTEYNVIDICMKSYHRRVSIVGLGGSWSPGKVEYFAAQLSEEMTRGLEQNLVKQLKNQLGDSNE